MQGIAAFEADRRFEDALALVTIANSDGLGSCEVQGEARDGCVGV
mgnify:CR=1 FL=1